MVAMETRKVTTAEAAEIPREATVAVVFYAYYCNISIFFSKCCNNVEFKKIVLHVLVHN
jgi:hypothetical protein